MKSICVFCGSADAVHAGYIEGARLMGRTLAERGIRLIYGGGKTGLMGVVADAVLEAGGVVVGVIIPSMNTAALAHIGLTQMDVVEGMHARKARMHELAEGYIAMPGGFWHLRRVIRDCHLGADRRARKTGRVVQCQELLRAPACCH